MLSRLTYLLLAGFVVAAVVTLAGCHGDDDNNLLGCSTAKNVILMISDGCGYNHILATNYYTHGKANAQAYEQWPVKYAMSTYSSDGAGYDPAQAWTTFNYVATGYTDSASAATAMSTGQKTYDKAIGVDVSGAPLFHFMSRAEEKGKSTGVVTSVPYSHATPAAFIAHNRDRNKYHEIAHEMLFASKADVIMGAGHPDFSDANAALGAPNYRYISETDWNAVKAKTPGPDADGDGAPDAWTLIETRAQFQSLMTGDTPKRVFGVPQVASTLQQGRPGAVSPYSADERNVQTAADTTTEPGADPYNMGVPTLAEMSRGALNVLDANRKGFCLMIEGGAIDWASHANQTGRMIEEEMEFNASVDAVIDWVNRHSSWRETLVIVTGDHECGLLWGPGSDPSFVPIVNNGKSNMPGTQWYSANHTNSLIPFFANGIGSDLFSRQVVGTDPQRGAYIDNTSIARVIFSLLN